MPARFNAIALLLSFMTPHVAIGADALPTASSDYPAAKVLANLDKRDDSINKFVDTGFLGRAVTKVTHIARLDPRNPSNDELGLSLIFTHADTIDSNQNFADFQSSTPVDGDAVHFIYNANQANAGKLFIVVFNVYGFKDFAYKHGKRIGNEDWRAYGRVSGLSGVNHIGMHFTLPENESVWRSIVPETDDRWWFGSCDLYLLE